LNWEWIDGLENNIETFNAVRGTDFASELDTAGSRNYFQLSARYQTSDRIEIYGGVSNLFNESPPLLGFGATQSNTAPQLYDVFGRRYFLGLSYRWE
jgi:outer membrane receptor protein involved in Fe transport